MKRKLFAVSCLAGLIAAAVAYTAPDPSESGPSLSKTTTTPTTSTTSTSAQAIRLSFLSPVVLVNHPGAAVHVPAQERPAASKAETLQIWKIDPASNVGGLGHSQGTHLNTEMKNSL